MRRPLAGLVLRVEVGKPCSHELRVGISIVVGRRPALHVDLTLSLSGNLAEDENMRRLFGDECVDSSLEPDYGAILATDVSLQDR